jgi:hypothetical protein
MAKFNGGVFSKAKGKLAGVVFQQYEGMQVGKEYQPNVKNPQTTAQVNSRAAFKLVSQFVALYKQVLILAAATVSRYERAIRGELIKRLRREVVFGLDDAELKLANAAAAVNSIQLTTPIPAPVIAGANISAATINATNGDRIEYDIVAYDENMNILGSSHETLTSTGVAQAIIAPLTVDTPHAYDVIAVATRALTEEGEAYYLNIDAGYSVAEARLVTTGDIAVSHVTAATIPQS